MSSPKFYFITTDLYNSKQENEKKIGLGKKNCLINYVFSHAIVHINCKKIVIVLSM